MLEVLEVSLAWMRRADGEVEPGQALAGAVEAEHLADDPELEHRSLIADDGRHVLQHVNSMAGKPRRLAILPLVRSRPADDARLTTTTDTGQHMVIAEVVAMIFAIFGAALVLLDVLAIRYSADTRDGRDWQPRDSAGPRGQ